MTRSRAVGTAMAVAALVGVGYGVGANTPRAVGQPAAAAAHGRYTVIETDVTNLIVTDNQTNTVYLYTVEKDAAPGSDLHLRGSLDLNDVGKPVLKPKPVAK